MEGTGGVLRHPLGWAGVLLAGLLGVVTAASYLGGFLDPTRHLEGLAVGVVTEDVPVEVAGRTIDAGADVVDQVVASDRREVEWVVYDTRAEALADLHDNELIGIVVVPEAFSARIGQLALRGGIAPRAELLMFSNDGAGLFQAQVFTRVREEVESEASLEVSRQLVAALDEFEFTILPVGSGGIAWPVVAVTIDEVPVTGRTARGLAPFYAAAMTSLTGLLAASIASLFVEVLRDREHLEVFGEELEVDEADRITTTTARPFATWAAKAVLTVAGASLGGVALAVTAVKLLGLDGAGAKELAALAALGASAVGLVTLVFLTVLGRAGELAAVIFVTIIGVPSALGIYPVEALPAFFRFTSTWHPMHYLTDGVRAMVFYDGRAAAGLGDAVRVLLVWAAVGLVLGGGSAWLIERRSNRRPDAATSGAVGGLEAVAEQGQALGEQS